MWLPVYRYSDEEDHQGFQDCRPITAWLASNESDGRLDVEDPLASKSSVDRDRPSKGVVKKYVLKADDVWLSSWSESNGSAVFRSVAWGRNAGKHEGKETGERLSVDTGFLLRLLAAEKKRLLLLIKLERYNERDASERQDGVEAFKHSWQIYTIDKDLKVKAYRRAKVDAGVVALLPEHSRYDFRIRLEVLRKSSRDAS